VAGDAGYKVGYKRPPKHSQFKKGDRVNPHGRPRGTRNLKTDLLEELAETIVIATRGRPKTISKQRAWVKKIVAQALLGEGQGSSQLITLVMRLLVADFVPDAAPSLGPEDEAILERYLERRMKLRAAVASSTPSKSRTKT